MQTAIKWTVVVLLLAAGGWLFRIPVDAEQEPYRALGYAAGGLACVAAAAGFFVVPVGRWLLDVIDGLFMPAGTYTPPALYKLAEWYIAEGRYADALAEYEKIQKNHPRDLAAFEGRLYVTHACMGDVRTAEAIYRKGIRRVPAEQRTELETYMQSLASGSAPVPNRSREL